MCCWFSGSHEGEADVAIYGARRVDDTGWSAPVKLADGAAANWNPVLFYREDGTLLLFYKQGQQIASWRTLVMESADDGVSWSEPAELVPGDVSGGRGPVRNKPIRLASGRVLAGASTEHGIWQAFADISDDDGCTWRKSSPVAIANLRGRKDGGKRYRRERTVLLRAGRDSAQPVAKRGWRRAHAAAQQRGLCVSRR